MLRGARRHPRPLHDAPGPLQGFHQHSQAQRLPLPPHHRPRPRGPQDRGPDPHPRDARGRGIRRRRALGLQAGPGADGRAPVPLGARAARHSRARREPRRIPREHEARPASRPGVRVHPPRRRGRPAARRDSGGLRLCDPLRDRRPLRGGEDRWPTRAPGYAAAERRSGGDPDEPQRRPLTGVGALRGHRQGAGADPAPSAHAPARCLHRPRPRTAPAARARGAHPAR